MDTLLAPQLWSKRDEVERQEIRGVGDIQHFLSGSEDEGRVVMSHGGL